MAIPFRRLHARFPCHIPAVIMTPVTESKIGVGDIVNLGIGGAQVRTEIHMERALLAAESGVDDAIYQSNTGGGRTHGQTITRSVGFAIVRVIL